MAGNLVVDSINGASIVSEPVLNQTQLKSALNASGTAPIYACRAWVNFNGTGTVAIRASGNVSSITDNGVGSYAINFTTVMSDTNYATIGNTSRATSATNVHIQPHTQSVGSVQILSAITNADYLLFDTDPIRVAIFR